jgi:CheY-like chemotaxis protein/two-component sensor histidine kinase
MPLRLIGSNGKNLLQLINQLLDISKLENKSFTLHLKQQDIIPYLRFLTESYQSYASDNQLTLRYLPQIDSLMMDFDQEQLKQVLTNLISNALKFTPSGGDIVIAVSKADENLHLEVKDSGIGIAVKDIPHIFDRFYQVDSTTTRIAQGTGIGLAHTQALVNIMGGRIAVESEVGKGTSVLVSIPVTNNEAIVKAYDDAFLPAGIESVSGIRNPPQSVDFRSIGGESLDSSLPYLLIIEDNPDVVTYLKSCLDDAYHIWVAYNGNTGIEIALEHIPDFIISDVMMPGKDGFQVLDALKNDERTSHIPIMLLTAKADMVSKLSGLRRGADAYLAKPFEVEELLVQIAVLLDNRKRMAVYFSKTLQQDEILHLTGDCHAGSTDHRRCFCEESKRHHRSPLRG